MKSKFFSLTFVALVISGCADVPTSSAIKEGSLIGTVAEGSIVRVIAARPQIGMSPEQILNGFLNAAASSENDYAIAREYLIPEIRNIWNPTAKIQVYENSGKISTNESGLVNFSAEEAFVINENFRITLSERNSVIEKTFSLKLVDEQWRIDLAEDGLLISRSDLNRSFVSYPLWFADNSFTTLVPDSVLLPRIISGNATRLMQLLLAGPSEKLANSVTSAIPIGTTLAINSVPIENGLATISLSETVLEAEGFQREVLSAQIVKTLTAITDIQEIKINVNGQSLIVPGRNSKQILADWVNFEPDNSRISNALAVAEGKVYEISTDEVKAFDYEPLNQKNWYLVNRNRAQNQYVAISSNRQNVVVINELEGKYSSNTFTGNQLKSAKMDIFNTIWIVGAEQLFVIDKGKKLDVNIEGISKADLVDVIPAPDGVRVLLISKTELGTELLLGIINRELQSIGISNIQRISNDNFSVKSATWQDEKNIVYLDASNENTNIYSLNTLNGAVKNISTLSGASSVAISPYKTLLIGTEDGTLQQRLNGNWEILGNFINPTYPG